MITSCQSDLDQNPIDPDLFTEVDVYSDASQARGALAKVYASLVLTGQQGPAGDPDIDNSLIDEGFSQYTHVFCLPSMKLQQIMQLWVGEIQVCQIFMKCHGM